MASSLDALCDLLDEEVSDEETVHEEKGSEKAEDKTEVAHNPEENHFNEVCECSLFSQPTVTYTFPSPGNT